MSTDTGETDFTDLSGNGKGVAFIDDLEANQISPLTIIPKSIGYDNYIGFRAQDVSIPGNEGFGGFIVGVDDLLTLNNFWRFGRISQATGRVMLETAVGSLGGDFAGWEIDSSLTVPDEAYDATSWNGSLEVPTKNAVRDKIESIGGGVTTIVGITGTLAEFNAALTGADFATGGGVVTGNSSGTNTGDQTTIVGITGTLAEFNAALTGADFATGGGTATGSNTGDQVLPTRASLGLDTTDSPQLAGLNVGHATDTTLSRQAAGILQVEANIILTEALGGRTLTGGSITPEATPTTTAPGYLGSPINTQNAAYTTVMGDAGKTLYHTDGTPRTWTIDSNANVAYPIGTIIGFVNENGGAAVTIAITSDTLRWGSSTGSRTLAANGACAAQKMSATVWRLTGDGLT